MGFQWGENEPPRVRKGEGRKKEKVKEHSPLKKKERVQVPVKLAANRQWCAKQRRDA